MRFTLAAAGLAFIYSIQASASDISPDETLHFTDPVFVTMKKSGTVERFPGRHAWSGGPNMLYDAISPDGKLVLATSPSTDSVYLFDGSTGQRLAIISVGKAPKGVQCSPNGRYAYVANQGSASISVIDLKAQKVVDTIEVEEAPHNVRFTSNGQRAYVTLQGGAGIGIIDTATHQQIGIIPTPGLSGPHNIDLSPDEKTAYVRDFVHHVAVVDLDSHEIEKIIKVGSGHGGIDASADGRFIATSAIASDTISIIDPHTFAVKQIKVGKGPHGIRASNDSRWLYVAVAGEDRVVVVDMQSMEMVERIPVGSFPFWVEVQRSR